MRKPHRFVFVIQRIIIFDKVILIHETWLFHLF
jgi:hypothetical protein